MILSHTLTKNPDAVFLCAGKNFYPAIFCKFLLRRRRAFIRANSSSVISGMSLKSISSSDFGAFARISAICSAVNGGIFLLLELSKIIRLLFFRGISCGNYSGSFRPLRIDNHQYFINFSYNLKSVFIIAV